MNSWQIGNVKITRVVELEVAGGSLFILPDATRDAALPIQWLAPHFMDERGNLNQPRRILSARAGSPGGGGSGGAPHVLGNGRSLPACGGAICCVRP